MGDLFYRVLRGVGGMVFRISSDPIVIGAERVPRSGAAIVAATHQSPFDVPLLIRHSKRLLDFVSIVEVFRWPVVGWIYGKLNAFPLDRSRPDAPTVRIVLRRLEAGRVVAMFPEGGLRREQESVVHTRRIRPGVGRIARLSNAPVIPCVVIDSGKFASFAAWLPLGRTRYGVMFGPPISPCEDAAQFERELVDSLVRLHAELSQRMAWAVDAV